MPIVVTLLGIVISVSCVRKNARSPISVIEDGITHEARSENANNPFGIFAIAAGSVIVLIPLLRNALSPILATPSGIVSSVMFASENAKYPIFVSPLGRIIVAGATMFPSLL